MRRKMASKPSEQPVNPLTIPFIIETMMKSSGSLSIKDLKNVRFLSSSFNTATRELLIQRCQPVKKLKSNMQTKSFVKKIRKVSPDIYRNLEFRTNIKTLEKKNILDDVFTLVGPTLVSVAIQNCTITWTRLSNILCNLPSLKSLKIILKKIDLPDRPSPLPNISALDMDVRPKSKFYKREPYTMLLTELFHSLPNLHNLRIFGKRTSSYRILRFILEYHKVVAPNLQSVIYDRFLNIHRERELVRLVQHKHILNNLCLYIEVPSSESTIENQIRFLSELGPRISQLSLSYWEGSLDFLKYLSEVRYISLFAVDLNRTLFPSPNETDFEQFKKRFIGLKKLEHISVSECIGEDRITKEMRSVAIVKTE